MNRRQLGKARSPGLVVGGIALLIGLAVVTLAVGLRMTRGTAASSTRADVRPVPNGLKPDAGQIRASYERLPLIFEKNQGQTDGRVRFVARGDGYGLFLTGNEAVLSLRHISNGERNFSALRMKLAGANAKFEVSGEKQLPGKSNYFIGNDPQKWQRDVPQFAGVRYREVYPGVDLVYHGNQGKLEYDFEVAPGAQPARVAMEFEGARPRLNADGDLILSLPGGDVAMHAPRAYQKVETKEQVVPSRFVINHDKVGFEVGDYDRSRALVIDPILGYSTYLGGSGNEACTLILGVSTPISGCPAVAVDQASNAYIAGSTESTNFPIPAGQTPFQSTLKGTANIFVAKFNSTGSTEEFATYIGGSGVDTTAGVAVDLAFNVVVTGNTSSPNFPVENAFQSSPLNTTNKHIFVSKVSPTGTSLLYSTYLSGLGVDVATGVALDPGGNAYVTGTTTSTEVNTGFPSTTGAFQTAPASGSKIQFFLTKINPTVAGVASVPYSTYFGGGNSLNTGPAAVGGGVAVDVDSNVYITGGTSFLHVGLSNDFPILNAFQGCLDQPGTLTGCTATLTAYDIFVAKINPAAITGTQLLYSTYVGGTGDDIAYGVAVDSSLSAYTTGSTTSSDFPAAGTGVFQPTYMGNTDAVMAKLGAPTTTGNLQGQVPLLYATYIGGTGTDIGLGIAVDSIEGARVTGWTDSTNFPVVNYPIQGQLGGGVGNDAFVARIDTNATTFNAPGHYSGYLGGIGADYGTGIAVDPQGASYVAGETQSSNFPIVAPFQSTLDGTSDAFLSKLAPVLNLGVTVTAAPSPVGVGNQATFTYVVTNNGDATNNVTFTDFLPPVGATFVSATSSPGTCGSASGGLVLCNIGTMNSNATATETIILIPNAPTTPSGNPVPLTNNGSAGIGGANQFNAPPATVIVNDYTLTVSPAQATTPAGVPVNFTATLTPTGAIPNSVSIACSGLPTGAQCVETTNPIPNLNQGPASTALVINTTTRVTTTTELLRKGTLYAAFLPIGGLTFLGIGIGSGSKKRRALTGLLLVCFFGLVLMQAGCGSKSTTNTTGTPAGTYVVTITATSNEASRSTTVNLVVQ